MSDPCNDNEIVPTNARSEGKKKHNRFQYFRKFQISIKLNISITIPKDQFSFRKDCCYKIKHIVEEGEQVTLEHM